MINAKKTKEQILKDYERESDAILQKMMQVFIRAQRKQDDAAYKKLVEKLEKVRE